MFNTTLREQLQSLGFRELCRHGNKHGHASCAGAEAQIRSILKEQERKPDRKDLSTLAPYQCGHCKLFFVGHGKAV